MAKKRDSFEWLQLVLIAGFILGLFSNVFVTGYQILNPDSIPEEKPIQFEVIGIRGSVNSSTMVGIHYECIKWCMDEVNIHGGSKEDCWAQCEKLGTECNK